MKEYEIGLYEKGNQKQPFMERKAIMRKRNVDMIIWSFVWMHQMSVLHGSI